MARVSSYRPLPQSSSHTAPPSQCPRRSLASTIDNFGLEDEKNFPALRFSAFAQRNERVAASPLAGERPRAPCVPGYTTPCGAAAFGLRPRSCRFVASPSAGTPRCRKGRRPGQGNLARERILPGRTPEGTGGGLSVRAWPGWPGHVLAAHPRCAGLSGQGAGTSPRLAPLSRSAVGRRLAARTRAEIQGTTRRAVPG